MNEYVHGYSPRETQRLQEQSAILEELLHSGTKYPTGSKVLEAGCGVGAQSLILAKNSPKAKITSIDMSEDSIKLAKETINKKGIKNVDFECMNIMDMSFSEDSFDHIFLCFVLEHVDDPVLVLKKLKHVLKPGGSITVIEGDHGSCFWHPETKESLEVWKCLIISQAYLGHNGLIGRQLYPLLLKAGFDIKNVSPRWVYTDANNEELMDGVVNKIIVPMVETAKERSLGLGLIDEDTWAKGIKDLCISGDPPEGTFFYTWFKGLAIKK